MPAQSDSTQIRQAGYYLVPVVALLLFVGAIGAPHLNGDGLWLDEWWSRYSAGAPEFGEPLSLAGIWQRQATEDPFNLPGFPWMISISSQFLGWSEFAGRAVSWFGGLLAVAVIARVGADSGGSRLGVAAALIASTSAWLIYYMHELRTFTLVAALTALLLLLYFRAERRLRSRVFYAALSLCCAALVYLHYFAALPVAALGLWHLANFPLRRTRETSWGAMVALSVGVLTLLPWLGTAFSAMQDMQGQQRLIMTPERLAQVGANILFVFSSGSALLFCLLAALGLSDRSGWRFWRIGGLTVLLIASAYVMFSVAEVRYAIALLPFLAIIAGLGILRLTRRGIPFALIAALMILGSTLMANSAEVWRVMQRTPPQPFREIAAHVAPRLTAEDRLIYVLAHDADTRGVHQSPFDFYLDPLPAAHSLASLDHLTYESASDEFAQVTADAATLWIAHGNSSDHADARLIEGLMQDIEFSPCADWHAEPRFSIRPFARVPRMAGAQGVTVASRLHTTPTVASAWLSLAIPPDTAADTYSVGVHLLNAAGQLQAQQDFPLPPTGQQCRLIEVPLNTLPPGEYSAQVVLYEWQSGERVRFNNADGQNSDLIRLGSVFVNDHMLQSSP